MNCLQIIQQACLTLGFSEPYTVTNTKDNTAGRLLGLLNRAVQDILREYQWQKMVKFCIFPADRQSQSYNPNLKGYNLDIIAKGFKSFMTSYIYDETKKREINSVTYDSFIKEKMRGSGDLKHSFILQNNHIIFMPELSEDTTISFFYKSCAPVYNFDSMENLITKEYFENDTDLCEINSELLLLGLIYKYKNELGFDYAESFRDYMNCLEIEKSADGNERNIKENNFISQVRANIPDTNIGL
jgi:hypothetical protein